MSTGIIDPRDMIPKYFQMCNIMRHKIEDGEWTPYSAIPSERQLVQAYHVSRSTIREAIGVLIRQGYLYREQGVGTFVAPQKMTKSTQELTSFSEDMKRRGMKPGQMILQIGFTEPPAKVIEKLELPGDTSQIFHVYRLRFSDDTPFALQTSYLALPNGGEIKREELESTGSLYEILAVRYNIMPTEAEETLEATLATAEEARLLQTAEGGPLLLSSRTLLGLDRHPIEFVKTLYRGDRYQYVTRVTR
jgi:GntR family transcriptional regulator